MSTEIRSQQKKITTHTLRTMKKNGEKIVAITAYDFTFGKLFDSAGVDMILVGDSASNVIAGNETTLPITLDEMIYHAKCVMKGVDRCFVLVDLPFGTYQGNANNGLQAAIRVMKETGAHGVKLEGGEEVIETIQKIVQAGIPVMGHLGLTPQSIYQFGSYAVRAKETHEAKALLESAKAIEQAGCFSILLEKIPFAVAQKITQQVHVPTIGIGAGNACDGQILVMHDLLGLNNDFHPRFVRRYANLENDIRSAIKNYANDVKTKQFPNESEQY